MSFNLVYGKNLESNFYDASEDIAKEFKAGRCDSGVTKKINDTFFGGGPLAPKPMEQLISSRYPEQLSGLTGIKPVDSTGRPICTLLIDDSLSFGEALGFIEGLPVIGSAIAVIKGLGHIFGMVSSYFDLKKAVADLDKTERSDYNVGRGAYLSKTKMVFNAAVSYTSHKNQLIGSLLSIIPLVKPIVRIAQERMSIRSAANDLQNV